MNFQDKVVIITGAGSGIGKATALEFAGLSAQLSLVDKNEETLKSALALCEAKGNRKHLAIVADLSKNDDVLTVIPKTIQRYGKINVLVNCAGTGTKESILDEDISENYDKVMAVNLKASIILCNKVAPYLVQTKGNVVNITSIASQIPCTNMSIYCVSKAGLEMFTKCMAKELASKGVRVTSIRPGVVRTHIYKNSGSDVDEEKYYKKVEKERPFGVIEPEEVARLVVFLASEEAKSVTGSSYTIDGGHFDLHL